jgi:hypothetical protein
VFLPQDKGMRMRPRLDVGILWGLFVLVAVAATLYGLKVVTDSVSKIVVAVITGAFGIMVAIATHALAELREREMEAWRKKQERYAGILERLGAYVRDHEQNNDAFATAVLQSYIVSAAPVIAKVRVFIDHRTAESLDGVVIAMRADLALAPIDAGSRSTPAPGDFTRALFPVPAPVKLPGGFPSAGTSGATS